MANLRLVAITPKRPLSISRTSQIRAGIRSELVGFAQDMVEAMAKYPPQQPTTYVRTGNLGRRWRFQPKPPSAIEVFNDAAQGGTRRKGRGRRRTSTGRSRRRPYAVYVEGPKTGPGPGTRQARVMRNKGWQNISDESQRIFAKHKGRISRILVVGS
jgi:hypothetical protein